MYIQYIYIYLLYIYIIAMWRPQKNPQMIIDHSNQTSNWILPDEENLLCQLQRSGASSLQQAFLAVLFSRPALVLSSL